MTPTKVKRGLACEGEARKGAKKRRAGVEDSALRMNGMRIRGTREQAEYELDLQKELQRDIDAAQAELAQADSDLVAAETRRGAPLLLPLPSACCRAAGGSCTSA